MVVLCICLSASVIWYQGLNRWTDLFKIQHDRFLLKLVGQFRFLTTIVNNKAQLTQDNRWAFQHIP